jgi:hypothetical protein
LSVRLGGASDPPQFRPARPLVSLSIQSLCRRLRGGQLSWYCRCTRGSAGGRERLDRDRGYRVRSQLGQGAVADRAVKETVSQKE